MTLCNQATNMKDPVTWFLVGSWFLIKRMRVMGKQETIQKKRDRIIWTEKERDRRIDTKLVKDR